MNEYELGAMREQNVEALDMACRERMATAVVAEEMGGTIAVMSAVIVYLVGGSWLDEHLGLLRWVVIIGVIPLVYTIAVRPYHKRFEAAQDAYERATGTGKYWKG